MLLRPLHRRSAPPDQPDEGGFSLIELVVAVGIGAFIFAALGVMLGGGLRALSVQKARTQGNEIASQGIEDLQRFDFNDLGLCGTPSGTAPDGLGSTVLFTCSPTEALVDPCAGTTGSVPDSEYTCRRGNIDYSVRRFVAWSDSPANTTKRLAVVVDWTDSVGRHRVEQQSSLRAPNLSSVIGRVPPTIASTTVIPGSSASTPIPLNGESPAVTVDIRATTTGLTNGDRMFVSFNVLREANSVTSPATAQLELVTGDGTNWTLAGGLSASTIDPETGQPIRLGAGSQTFTFTSLRTIDGKVNSAFSSPASVFCPTTGCPSTMPTFTGTPNVPSAVNISSSGLLLTGFTVSVATTNLTVSDTVKVHFQTQTGAQSLVLLPKNSAQCDTTGNRNPCSSWEGVFEPSSGYRFLNGQQTLYFTAAQIYDPDPASVDKGSTAITSSGQVNFS